MPTSPTSAIWRKSSYSTQNGSCVEVADARRAVAVRDSKHPSGGSLTVSRRVWGAFTGELRSRAAHGTADVSAWRKSSYSTENGSCVEVADARRAVAVRDSKHPLAGSLMVSRRGWGAFMGELKRGA